MPLHAPVSRPGVCRATKNGGGLRLKRQNREMLDARTLSPLVQDFLEAADSLNGQVSQPLGRTVPISWAVGGGADTHKHYPVATQLHDELSGKFEHEHHKIKAYQYHNHLGRMNSALQLTRECNMILESGSTAVSRYSLDLVKKQRNQKAKNRGAGSSNVLAPGVEDIEGMPMTLQAAMLLEQQLGLEEDDSLEEYMQY